MDLTSSSKHSFELFLFHQQDAPARLGGALQPQDKSAKMLSEAGSF
jgi:hypothetical protein